MPEEVCAFAIISLEFFNKGNFNEGIRSKSAFIISAYVALQHTKNVVLSIEINPVLLSAMGGGTCH